MEEKKESVHQIMIKVVNEICDNYCKWPDILVGKNPGEDEDMLEEMLYEQYCANCPMNRLC